ncbi:MAG TPA: hypothetical protein VHN36_16540, partial [Ilumatobacteraceae bacterium]|nr:hypothetical protein [Ilumatobacteraceae bacterium]
VGSSGVSANIDATASAAVFDFEPPDSRTYVVEVKPAITLDAVVQMTEPNGVFHNEDWGAEGGTETALVDSAVKGRYLFVVTGFETTMGKFDVSVRPADMVETDVGDTKSATIDASNPAAVFEFDASDGRPLTISVEPDNSLHPVLQLIDPTGTSEEVSNFDEGGAVTLPVDGTAKGRYRVVVRGYKSTTGRFQLSVQAG